MGQIIEDPKCPLSSDGLESVFKRGFPHSSMRDEVSCDQLRNHYYISLRTRVQTERGEQMRTQSGKSEALWSIKCDVVVKINRFFMYDYKASKKTPCLVLHFQNVSVTTKVTSKHFQNEVPVSASELPQIKLASFGILRAWG